MPVANCLPERGPAAAASMNAELNKLLSFIDICIFSKILTKKTGSTYITRAPGATMVFSDGLAIRPKAFLSFQAPINPARELIFLFIGALVIHFLIAKMPARKTKFGGCFWMIHDQSG